jgi:hypothetical protein
VARVGDERALALERRLEPAEHRVQGRAEAADLVVGGRDREAGARIAALDRGRTRAHALDGAQRGGGRPIPRQRGEQQRDRAAREQQRAEAVDGLVAVLERLADHDREPPPLGLRGSRQQARGVVVVDRVLAVDEERLLDRAPPLGRGQQRPLVGLVRAVDHPPGRVEDLREVLVLVDQGAAAGVGEPGARAGDERAHVSRARAQAALDAGVELRRQPQVQEQAGAAEHDRHHRREGERHPQADRQPAHRLTLPPRMRAA